MIISSSSSSRSNKISVSLFHICYHPSIQDLSQSSLRSGPKGITKLSLGTPLRKPILTFSSGPSNKISFGTPLLKKNPGLFNHPDCPTKFLPGPPGRKSWIRPCHHHCCVHYCYIASPASTCHHRLYITNHVTTSTTTSTTLYHHRQYLHLHGSILFLISQIV